MKNNLAIRRLVEGGMIAAMYTALTLVFAPISYGLAQFRISEVLTILPVFTPVAVPGLAVGCMVSNLVGLAYGVNLVGAWDVLFGSLATLAAAWITYKLRNYKIKGLPIFATLPPVLINAVVIGIELTIVLQKVSFAVAALYVFVGQFASCTVCGLILYAAIKRLGPRPFK